MDQGAGLAAVDKEVLSRRTGDYQHWVEAFARNHDLPIEWAESGVRKEDHVRPWLKRMEKKQAWGVYFIFKSMEQGRRFRISQPKYPTQDPNHRILAHQGSRHTHYYFYIRDEVLGPSQGPPAVPDHHRPLCHLPGPMAQRACRFSAAAQRVALPITVGSVRYPGINIPKPRVIRRLEVPLHSGTAVGGWTAKQIHQAVLTSFQCAESRSGRNQLRYGLRKRRGHGLVERDGKR